MKYRVFADILVMIHFLWILFMLAGFFMTLWAMICRYCRHQRCRFLDRWILRSVHLGGIAYVGLLAMLGKYCPLTVWEYRLRLQDDPDLAYPGSFIASIIERLVYPSVPPAAILIPTLVVAGVTLAAFVICPPEKIKRLWSYLISWKGRR